MIYNSHYLTIYEDAEMMFKDIFVYYLDNELQKLFSLNKYNYDHLYSVLKLVTRVAFLICKEKILIPASNYFESDLSFGILNELRELNEIGAIDLISSSHNINELLSKKVGQHGDNILLPHYHYRDFLNDCQKIILPGTLRKRERSASSDIKTSWYTSINNSEMKNALARLLKDTITASKFEDMLYEVPHKLGDRAYISDYILPLLPIENEKAKSADYILNVFITREYIASFLKEFNASCLKDIPIIDSNAILPKNLDDNTPYVSYNEIAIKLKMLKYNGVNALLFVNNCSAYELIEFKNSIEWRNVLETLVYHKTEFNNIMEGKNVNNYSNVKIGIITALPKECAAMKMMMSDVKECFFDDKGAGHRYYLGKLKSANGKTHRVALAQCGMGNNKAAIRATNMLNHFKSIDSIIMTGIAGGIPSYKNDDKQVRLGDIVVSDGVTQYDLIKETPKENKNSSNAAKPSALLLEAIDIMKTYEYEDVYPWHEYLDEFSSDSHFFKPSEDTDKLYDLEGKLCEHPYDSTRTKYPKVFMGKIASANTLLKNPNKRDMLKSTYGVLAVEMETSGIADATWNYEVGYLAIRGICDYCDTHKNDLWQEYAALAAAAYTRSLIEMLPCF